MKFYLPVILVFAGQFTLAQPGTDPTRFDRFVKKKNIEWAAYASDTFDFSSAGLNILLHNKLSSGKIKASLPMASRTTGINQVNYLPLAAIDEAFYGSAEDDTMNAEGNPIKIKRPVPEKTRDNFKITEVTQILYVEKGKLKSYIPFVTPALPEFTSTGSYVGERFYFNSSYNNQYNCRARNVRKLVFLRQTKSRIPLTGGDAENNLKKMYGKDLLETLWPKIMNGTIQAYTVDGNKLIPPEAIETTVKLGEPVLAPIYDESGNVVKYEVQVLSVIPQRFDQMDLVQDWYYDSRRDKVYNSIREAWLYSDQTGSDGTELKNRPLFKLVFK